MTDNIFQTLKSSDQNVLITALIKSLCEKEYFCPSVMGPVFVWVNIILKIYTKKYNS